MPQDKKIAEIAEKLKEGIKRVFDSGEYADYLKTMSRFHSYSPRNSLLIHLQNPDATQVAGFSTWKRQGRSIGRGEKGMEILAPAFSKRVQVVDKDENGKRLEEPQQIKVTVPYYKVVYVFDVSQTHGNPLPEIAKRLEGNVPNFKEILAEIEKQAAFPIHIGELTGYPSGCNGYCSYGKKEIVIREGLSESQTIKTAIHETAHSLYHDLESVDRQTAEVEAESTAFIVCEHLGIDTSDYSFGYVASWAESKDAKVLGASLNNIQRQAAEIIEGIDKERDLIKEMEVEKAALLKEITTVPKDLTTEHAKQIERLARENGLESQLPFMTLTMAHYDDDLETPQKNKPIPLKETIAKAQAKAEALNAQRWENRNSREKAQENIERE